MILLGALILFISISYFFIEYLFDHSAVAFIISCIIFLIGSSMIVWDITSPVEVTNRIIISNTYKNITYEKPMEMKIYSVKPIRRFTFFNKKEDFKIEVKEYE